MRANIKFQGWLSLILIVLGLVGYTAHGKDYLVNTSSAMYTAYNLWYEKPDVIWSINYKKGRLIPAGSPVTNIKVKEGRKARISFMLTDGEQEYIIYFQKKFHPGMTVNDIHKRLFTATPLDERIAQMTDIEKECIKKGVIKPNISKEAVLIAYGYPPEHATHSLDLELWYYWVHRFGQRELRFDDNGKTITNLP